MTYAELLQSYEWRYKRAQILKKDEFKCQCCNNEKFLSDYEKGVIVGNIDEPFFQPQDSLTFFIVRIFTAPKPIFNCRTALIDKQKLIPDFKKTTSIAYYISEDETNAKIIAIRKIEPTNYQIFKKRDLSLPFEEHILFPYSDEITKEISVNEWKNFKWIFVDGLHVHHHYYIRDKNPWEYPDNALTTFCWHCHEEFHQGGKIKELDEEGNILGELTYCYRCHGAGYFPEYAHIEHGICFRCNGARFEELIV